MKKRDERVEYLYCAAYGYLNGFNDCGPIDYPPMSMEEIKRYAWETVEFDRRHGDPTAKMVYFMGKDRAMAALEKEIRADREFKEVVTDW